MNQSVTIRFSLEAERSTTELAVPGKGDLEHLLVVFRLALSTIGVSAQVLEELVEIERRH